MLFNKIKSLGFLILATLGFQSLYAQGHQVQPLPIDPQVRYGKLDNGLTYFIRHNEQPKDRAHFYIAQKVGSMLEEDSQSGLAHFLEHMAFNGTKNFPGKNLINYLETIGVKFGSNLNAYTGFEETVYTIMDAPTTRQGIVDSCLLILHDWSNNITLDHKEIDDERGVIHEEWRGGQNASMRMIEKLLPLAFPNGHLYGKRLPIGSMDVVLNFKYQEIKDYYKKWYRPDLQALIIVGDIDVDYVENKIKEQFADVKKPENAAERFYAPIPDNKEPIVAIVTDPEATSTSLSFSYARDVLPEEVKASADGFLLNYLSAAASTMFNQRIAEILQKPNAPFLSAGMSSGPLMGLAKTKDALGFDITAKEGQYLTALNAVVAELKRARDFGFTASEYDRFRTNMLKSSEEAVKNKANRSNGSYAEEYKDFFTEGGSIPGVEVEHQILSAIAAQFTVDHVNEYFRELAHGENLLIAMMAPEKEGLKYPTEAELLAQYNAALQQKVEPYKEEVSNEKLIEKLPKKGKVVSVKKGLPYGTTLWTLSNGAKVYLKKSDLKENQIILSGVSPGGYRMLDISKDTENLKVMDGVIGLGGIGNFSNIQLAKALTGRVASASTGIGEFTETVSGSSNNADIETMFQLVYLNMTAKRQDSDAYQAFMQNATEALRSAAADPMSAVADSIPAMLFPENVLRKPLKEADLSKVNYDRIMQIYRERFADAGDFTFFIIGTFDEATLKPLVEQYLASLPKMKRKDVSHYEQATGITKNASIKHFNINADTRMAEVYDVYVSQMPYDLETRLKTSILGEILTQQYQKTIREDEGGTYGVGANASISKYPKGQASILINFKTAPEKVQLLNDKIKKELQEMAEHGINKEYFNKTVKNMEISFQNSQDENSYWLGVIMSKFYHNEDNHPVYLETLRKITPESIQQYLKDFLKGHRYFEMVVTSEGKQPAQN